MNKRINDQVKIHYAAQKSALDTQLYGMRMQAEGQLAGFNAAFKDLHENLHYVQELTEKSSDLAQKTFEQSKQQAEQLQQATRRIDDVVKSLEMRVDHAQRQAEALDRLVRRYQELIQDWFTSGKISEFAPILLQKYAEEAPKSDNSADTTPPPDKPNEGTSS